VWTAKVGTALGIKSKAIVVPAKGIHITVDPRTLPIKSAMIIPSVRGDDRFCFAVPWYDSIVIGTTDTEYNGDLDDVRVEPNEIQYVLDAVNAMFPAAKLTPSKVTGSYAGLRPLIKDPSKSSTADLSRGHSLDVSPNGLISIAGGKLTTYRPMAESVVDVVCKRLLAAGDVRKVGPKITHTLRLGGWKADQDARRGMLGMWQDALQYRLGEDTAGYLLTAYGRRTREVLELVRADKALAGRISPKHPYIMAQVWYAVTAEGAMTIDDVLSRRIRLSITDGTAALKAAEPVSHLMAQLLGWSSETRAAQVEEFRERLGA
jgi:glycerol-3-phosphate dehydrogenase